MEIRWRGKRINLWAMLSWSVRGTCFRGLSIALLYAYPHSSLIDMFRDECVLKVN
jgi:hypothetical protein